MFGLFYRFTKLRIEPGYRGGDIGENIDKCPYDALIVFEESDIEMNNTENIFCGNLDYELPEIKSKTNTMYVQLITDNSRGDEGFSGEISFIYGKCSYF